jgi:hypothetical protein
VLVLRGGFVGAGGGGVQLDQGLAAGHAVAVADEHALDDAALQRLYEFGAFTDHHAPGRDGDDVDLAEDGPDQRNQKQRHDGVGQAARRGVHGGVLQTQRGGQKGGFVAQAPGAGEFVAVRPGGGEDGAVAGQQGDDGVHGPWRARAEFPQEERRPALRLWR